MTLAESAPTESVLIIDYGLGNLLSLRRALEHIGVQPVVSSNPADIGAASRIILPGVGSFSEASRSLHEGGFAKQIVAAAGRGVPTLGISLGMQVLFDEGHENGISPGLGLIPGNVRRILKDDNTSLPRTHIGWRYLESVAGQKRGSPKIKFPDGPFYFVHSYRAVPSEPCVTGETVSYGAVQIPAIVQQGNIIGVQFHPEKSRLPGLDVLTGFCMKNTCSQSAVS